jgi:hypothetical protein
MKVTTPQIKAIAIKYGIDFSSLMAIMATETPMNGFDAATGKLLIQFEPVWFKRRAPFMPSGKWSVNKVDVQSKEWLAFNDAFLLNPTAAMEATSIGLPQILGVNYKECGYKSVHEMWDDFKLGEANQVEALCRFILNNKRLYTAVKAEDWHTVAEIYNGKEYQALAAQLGREPYNITLAKNKKIYLAA